MPFHSCKSAKHAIGRKRPEKWASKKWVLLHDNAPAHRSLLVKQYLSKQDEEKQMILKALRMGAKENLIVKLLMKLGKTASEALTKIEEIGGEKRVSFTTKYSVL